MNILVRKYINIYLNNNNDTKHLYNTVLYKNDKYLFFLLLLLSKYLCKSNIHLLILTFIHIFC